MLKTASPGTVTVELLTAYWPKVRSSGVIAGHDYDLAGVRDAVAVVLGSVQTRGRSFFMRRPQLKS